MSARLTSSWMKDCGMAMGLCILAGKTRRPE
jgi:hypothetical protein